MMKMSELVLCRDMKYNTIQYMRYRRLSGQFCFCSMFGILTN